MTEETKDVSVDEAAQAALLLDDAIAERLLNIIKTRPEMALALATALDDARYRDQLAPQRTMLGLQQNIYTTSVSTSSYPGIIAAQQAAINNTAAKMAQSPQSYPPHAYPPFGGLLGDDK